MNGILHRAYTSTSSSSSRIRFGPGICPLTKIIPRGCPFGAPVPHVSFKVCRTSAALQHDEHQVAKTPKPARHLAPNRYIVFETEGTSIYCKVSCCLHDQGRDSHVICFPRRDGPILGSLLAWPPDFIALLVHGERDRRANKEPKHVWIAWISKVDEG